MPHVRGKALVAKVLDAAIRVLAELGYERLTMEDVAKDAGVNKTTLYRRWSSKRELMHEALARFSAELPPLVDHGSFRADLVGQLKRQRDLFLRPEIRELTRMSWGKRPHEDIAEVGGRLRAEHENELIRLYQRAIARGELPPTTDLQLLQASASGAIKELVMFHGEAVSDERIERLATMLLDGVLH